MHSSSRSRSLLKRPHIEGYIGGTVLHKLLKHSNAKSFEISAFVRSPEKAKQLEEQFGVRAIVGSYKDLPLLEQHVEKARVVYNCVRVQSPELSVRSSDNSANYPIFMIGGRG